MTLANTIRGTSLFFLLALLGAVGCSTSVTVTANNTDTCTASAAVSCITGATGYSCTGAATPDTTLLLCSEPTATASGNDYCCLPVATGTLTCAQDQTVTCPQAGSYGFSCTSTDSPSAEYSDLTCSTGTAANGATQYCCVNGTTTAASCAQDTTLSCVTGATGWSCTGNATPDATTLLCSEPAATAAGANYCCLPVDANAPTCAQDQTVTCPQVAGAAVSYGFSCTSTDTPATEYPGLNCSAGVVVGTATEYCCQ